MSVNSEVPNIHLALQHALLGKPVNTVPPNTLQMVFVAVGLNWFRKNLLRAGFGDGIENFSSDFRSRYVTKIRAGKILKFSQHTPQFYHGGTKITGRVGGVKNGDSETERSLVHSYAHGPQRPLLDFLGPKVVGPGIRGSARRIFF